MIKIENFVGPSPEQWGAAIRGMRNPKNSWGRLDSSAGRKDGFHLGENDKTLAQGLCLQGREHRKFLRQLPVIMDITAPLYFWKQMDSYKVGTVTDSCSTMHRLTDKPFEVSDFSADGWCGPVEFGEWETALNVWGEEVTFRSCKPDAVTVLKGFIIDILNVYREAYLRTGDPVIWRSINGLLPQSYNQKRTWSANYETLRNICRQREGHKLSEWADFIQWVRENVPYAEELVFRCGAEKRGGAE